MQQGEQAANICPGRLYPELLFSRKILRGVSDSVTRAQTSLVLGLGWASDSSESKIGDDSYCFVLSKSLVEGARPRAREQRALFVSKRFSIIK